MTKLASYSGIDPVSGKGRILQVEAGFIPADAADLLSGGRAEFIQFDLDDDLGKGSVRDIISGA